ncbi:AAA family ATPase [Mesorhizobium sp. M2A.F.Ca.ET.039.01.1.1]|uniref:AAA family ATPase n=1 Tax=Mesorhizobium sp. M2A.F.Ca.ET.039.01.1.1 TaxID=2496746 RepID=UPI000FCB6041|nr:AAA family ATPase [Mesorhizobium sp. M2A.F.Ca.ET.039.01.1.1]RWX72550.1 hypothetical protein EOA24_00735 [Mesorhizobium sp. M2A.F.Ca.ET.039.01.1.1]
MASGDKGDQFAQYIRPVAEKLWGQPRKGGTAKERRFGETRTINENEGTWYVHNDDRGGGVLDLIVYEGKASDRKEAVEWMKREGFYIEDSRPAQPGSNRNAKAEGADDHPSDGARKELVKTWDYTDEAGAVLYQTMRYQFRRPDGSWRPGEDGKPEKTYSQRRKAQPGEQTRDGWVYSLKDARIVPYRLPELIEAVSNGYRVFFVEGEKAADRLLDLGIPATCNPMGAGKWWDELTPYFAGADVCILPDNDPQSRKKSGELLFHEDGRPKFAGKDHALLVASKLKGTAAKIATLELPDLPLKGDAWDWIEAGGTAERLYELAAQAKAPELPAYKSKFGAVWFNEIGKQKPQRDWLIKNLILAKSFGIAYGPPGCGKSFLISDMMLSCAAGALMVNDQRPEWFGYRGRAFGVVYVVAEGREDFEIRLHAWRAEHDIPADAFLPFVFLPTSIDMRSSDADMKKLAEEIREIDKIMRERCGCGVGVTVIDTVARALAGGNENDSQVMGSFIINCDKLKEATGAAVLGVHHGGKEAGRGPRGHEALHGAADFEIEVTGATPDTPNLWTVRKLKAGPAGATHRFRLRQTTVGQDDDGDPITSCVVINQKATEAASGTEKPKGFKARDPEKEFLSVLADTIDKKGVMPPPDLALPKGVVLVASADDVRAAFKEKYTATEEGTDAQIETRLRTRWSRATKAMLKFNIIGSKRPWIWFTGREVQGVHIKGVSRVENTYVEPPEREDGDPGITDDDVSDLIG